MRFNSACKPRPPLFSRASVTADIYCILTRKWHHSPAQRDGSRRAGLLPVGWAGWMVLDPRGCAVGLSLAVVSRVGVLLSSGTGRACGRVHASWLRIRPERGAAVSLDRTHVTLQKSRVSQGRQSVKSALSHSGARRILPAGERQACSVKPVARIFSRGSL